MSIPYSVHTVLDLFSVKNISVTVSVLKIIVVTTMVGNGRHYAIQSQQNVVEGGPTYAIQSQQNGI
jgi:hypothetical protein